MKRTFVFILSVFFIAGSSSALAEGSVKIKVKLSPAGSFTAISDKVKGDLIKSGNQISSDKLSVSIETLKTGMSLRDEHLAKHLNASTYPKIFLTQLKGADGKAKATFEINGVKKEVDILFVEKADAIEAQFNLNTADFKLPKVKYLGVGVSEAIQGEARVIFQKK